MSDNNNVSKYLSVLKTISAGVAQDNRLVESIENEKEVYGFLIESLGVGMTKTEILNQLTEEGMDMALLKGFGLRIDNIASMGLEAAEAKYLGEGELSEEDLRLAALMDVLAEDGLTQDEIADMFLDSFTESHEYDWWDGEDELAEGGPGSGRRAKNDVYGFNIAKRHPVGSRKHLEAYVRALSVPKARTAEKRKKHVQAIRLLMGGRNSMAEIIKRTGLHAAEVHKHRANIAHAENYMARFGSNENAEPNPYKKHLHDMAGERVSRAVRGDKRRANRRKKSKTMKEDVEIPTSEDENLDEGVFSRGKYYARKFLGRQRSAVNAGLQKRALRHYRAADTHNEAGKNQMATSGAYRQKARQQRQYASLSPSKADRFYASANQYSSQANHAQGQGLDSFKRSKSSLNTARNAFSGKGPKFGRRVNEEMSILEEIEYLLNEGFTEDEIEELITDLYSAEELAEAAEAIIAEDKELFLESEGEPLDEMAMYRPDFWGWNNESEK